MTRQWRLRHKLLLGFSLVLASMALLVVGAWYGLNSYTRTMNLVDKKIVELHDAWSFKQTIDELGRPADQIGPEVGNELSRLHAGLRKARSQLHQYEIDLKASLERHREPSPEMEKGLVDVLHQHLDDYENALNGLQEFRPLEHSQALIEDPEIKAVHHQLVLDVNHLHIEINETLFGSIDRARKNQRWSKWVVGVACGYGVILLLLLTQQFRKWVFGPIRLLQSGVQAVATGHFNQPIILRSGDELQELADAFNDMTRRLRDIYRDLAQQVNERSRQLVRSERMVSVGFLAAGVAHEINNPLASIAFCSEALDRRLEPLVEQFPEDNAVIRKYLQMIQQEAFRCKEITSKLLEFSRVGERRREPTELTELIQSVLEIAQHLQNCKGKQILFHPTSRLYAAVNGQDIKSVVLNLVVNALDSMEEGGTLTITLRPQGQQAEMIFTDTGCGMEPEMLDNIFEPFFTRSRTGKGTGLGLFISHQIIDQHHGSITATSLGPNLGSTFVVRIPQEQADYRSERAIGQELAFETTASPGHTRAPGAVTSAKSPPPDPRIPRLESRQDGRTEDGLGNAAA